MSDYRIIKRTSILYGPETPKRYYWYVIQTKVKGVFTLWISFWMDMHFDNYPDSIMNFNTLEKAKKYLKQLKAVDLK